MQELLFGTWGSQIIVYGQQYPWRVFAIVLTAILLLDLIFRKQTRGSGDSGDFSGFDFGGDGDGGCGD